jgi:hypothetical protein
MLRCLDCNSSLKKGEVECFACGSRVPVESKQTIFGQRFATFIKFTFIFSLIITPASLFLESLSFSKCATTTLVLFFVKSSADQMLEKKKV